MRACIIDFHPISFLTFSCFPFPFRSRIPCFPFLLLPVSGFAFKRILHRSLYCAERWPAVTRTTVSVTGTTGSPSDHLELLPP